MVEHGGNTRIMSNSADEQTISKVKSSNILSCFVDEVDLNLHVGWWPTEQASQKWTNLYPFFYKNLFIIDILCNSFQELASHTFSIFDARFRKKQLFTEIE